MVHPRSYHGGTTCLRHLLCLLSKVVNGRDASREEVAQIDRCSRVSPCLLLCCTAQSLSNQSRLLLYMAVIFHNNAGSGVYRWQSVEELFFVRE